MSKSHCLRTTLFLATAIFAAHAGAQDGVYDSSWNGDGRTLIPVGDYDDTLQNMAVQNDGKIVLAGHCRTSGSYYTCAARLLPTGVVDLSFGPNETGAFVFDEIPNYANYETIGLHGLVIQPDGHILIAGHGTFYFGSELGSHEVATIARLTPSGSGEVFGTSPYVSLYFSYNTTAPENEIDAAAVLPNGKIIVVGDTNRADSTPPNRDFAVARLNPDLSTDTTFNAGGATPGIRLAAFDQGGGDEDRAHAVAIQADGKIVVVGSVQTSSNGLDIGVLRLNADGTPDASFGNNGRVWYDLDRHFDDIGYAVKIDDRGRIVIAGSRQFQDDDHDFVVVRLLPGDGSLDTSMSGLGYRPFFVDVASPYTDDAFDLAIQGDHKIVLVGTSASSSTTTVAAAVRVNEDGSTDNTFGASGKFFGSFAPGSGISDEGRAVAIADGGLFIAGDGESGPGSDMLDFGIARLTLDEIFGDGFD